MAAGAALAERGTSGTRAPTGQEQSRRALRALRSLAVLVVIGLTTYVGPPRELGGGGIASSQPAPRVGTASPLAEGAPATEAAEGWEEQRAADAESVWALADRFSAGAGIDDRRVLRALILAESDGNPGAVRRTAREWSVGLLQANRLGGRGVGYSEAELQDPAFNLALGMPEISAAYRRATAEGYRGAPRAVRVAELAQRPDPATLHRYAAAYDAA